MLRHCEASTYGEDTCCQQLLKVPSDPREKRPLRRLCAGAMAGIMSVTVTYPLDLIRTRLSVQAERRVAKRKYR